MTLLSKYKTPLFPPVLRHLLILTFWQISCHNHSCFLQKTAIFTKKILFPPLARHFAFKAAGNVGGGPVPAVGLLSRRAGSGLSPQPEIPPLHKQVFLHGVIPVQGKPDLETVDGAAPDF